jgi:LacI family transcriptional regulator
LGRFAQGGLATADARGGGKGGTQGDCTRCGRSCRRARSTVSLVLNGRGQGNIAPDKQQAIIAAARQLNYTPNAVALSLRNRRSRIIGVLTWPGASGFAERMLHAALQAATKAGYLFIFMDTANDRDHQGQALATLHDHQVDGLLVIAPDLIEYRPVEVMSSIQTILVNCLDPSASLTTVAPDEYGAGSAAARVLIEAGHTSIGVVAEPSDKMQNRLRLAGIQAATTEQTPFSVQTVPDRDMGSGFDAARTLLSAPGTPTALICTHERLAVGARLAASDLGLVIPTDLSIVSLDDGELLASRLVPPLTRIERPDRAMAEQAVTVLLERLDDDSGGSNPQFWFSCQAASGDSAAHPRRLQGRPCRPADKR